MIGMDKEGFLQPAEAVVADSDLLKKKLDALRFSGPQKLQVCCAFVFESDVSTSRDFFSLPLGIIVGGLV